MTAPATTTVLVADDHAVVRHGVRSILNAQPDFEVRAEACDGVEAVEKAVALRRRSSSSTCRCRACPASTPRPRSRAAPPRSGC